VKAIQLKKYGSSDVVEVNEIGVPSLTSGKILVNIKVCGINPVDWKIREGYMQQVIQLQFPSTLGLDFSGVI
jgi:alcohol dehydrogenase